MPKIFEYLGIIISFYSNEHEPIHIHAKYGSNVIKVAFHVKEGKITRTVYTVDNGRFSPSKLKDLKEFVSVYKETIIQMWVDHFILHKKIVSQNITKKL